MRSAARKSAGSLRAFRGWLLKIRIIPRGILRKVYSAIPHKNVRNLCQVPYTTSKGKSYACSCKPTMRKQPPFYKLSLTIARSVQLEGPQFTIESANCHCAAGETQSCVHVTALLFTLAELSPATCTSLPCALVCKNSSCSRGKSLSSVASLVSHSSLL